MPYTIVKDGEMFCVHKEMPDGTAGEKVKCHSSMADARAHMRAMYANVEDAAQKYWKMSATVKATGDWELDVLAVPFNSIDSDQQWFDENTDIMHEQFQTPLIVYQHGVKKGSVKPDGRAEIDCKPVVVGKSVPGTLEKKADGWHIRVILDKAIKYAKDIMEAAKNGMVAVSSGSIAHLARLDVGGKLMQYEKDRPGRIAVWGLAEVSLWDRSAGNANPANQFAVAMPVMKAMYRDAGIPFPELISNTSDASKAQEVRKRTQIALEKEEKILKRNH